MRSGPYLYVLAVAALGLSGCQEIAQQIGDRVRQAAPGNAGGDADAGTDEPEIEINSLQPNRGSTLGGDLIEIAGFGFDRPGLRVAFGFNWANDSTIEILSDTNIRVVTPEYGGPQMVNVRVTDGAEAALLENGFEYFTPVTVISVAPGRGPTAGGNLVSVIGTGFVDGTQVTFGDLPAIAGDVIDSATVMVTAPAMPRGTYRVTVENLNGEATLPGAYQTYEPVTVDGIEPFAGPIGGGTDVVVSGTGFVPGTELRIGDQVHVATENAAETDLSTTTLMANPAVEGAVSISVSNPNGDDDKRNAYVYYDPTDLTPRIIAVTPSTGLIEGGREVHVVVGGMPDNSSEVFFGNTPVTCTVLDEFRISCIAPAAGEGSVDVRVINGSTEVVRTDGFSYIDLRMEVLLPDRGSVAGGTWVRIFGSGFGPDAELEFDGRLARDVVVDNPTELSLRTPPGAIGLVPVRIETQDVEITVPDIYEYFDPTDFNNVSAGGPVDGAINVSVFDGAAPVPNAFVILGDRVDPTRPHLHGFTDQNGRITISGPEVFGPQSVHAGKGGYGNFSWIDIDAENVTMFIQQDPPLPPDPMPECPMGMGEPPPSFDTRPLIRGRVYRVKDEWNTGNDYVIVTTTFEGPGGALPEPGLENEMVSQGEYKLLSRTGDLAVVALAGMTTPDGLLDVHAMGFAPFINAQPGSGFECTDDPDCPAGELCIKDSDPGICRMVYDGVDVIIDTPLNRAMMVELDDPPLGLDPFTFPAAPDQLISVLWQDFGYQGWFPMMNFPLGPHDPQMGVQVPAVVVPGTDRLLYDMPKILPAEMGDSKFSVYVSVEGSGAFGDPAWSSRFEPSVEGYPDTVVMTPMLQVPSENVPPIGAFSTTDPLFFSIDLLPSTTSAPDPTVVVHYNFEFIMPMCIGPFGPQPMQPAPDFWLYWLVAQPHHASTFRLPKFPPGAQGANLPGAGRPCQQDIDCLTGQTCNFRNQCSCASDLDCRPGGTCNGNSCIRQINWQMLGTYDPLASYNDLDIDNLLFRSLSESGRVSAYFWQ